jgi:hypothetical protein
VCIYCTKVSCVQIFSKISKNQCPSTFEKFCLLATLWRLRVLISCAWAFVRACVFSLIRSRKKGNPRALVCTDLYARTTEKVLFGLSLSLSLAFSQRRCRTGCWKRSEKKISSLSVTSPCCVQPPPLPAFCSCSFSSSWLFCPRPSILSPLPLLWRTQTRACALGRLRRPPPPLLAMTGPHVRSNLRRRPLQSRQTRHPRWRSRRRTSQPPQSASSRARSHIAPFERCSRKLRASLKLVRSTCQKSF